MNILILTPDGVGSTILQRILTLALHLDGKDVVNCHELTNGLSLKDNRVHKDFSIGYSQTLEQIIDLLEKSDDYYSLVSRFARYHLHFRNDSKNDLTKFYSFLKQFNNKIIVSKRKNIFEYAMSWSIRNESKVLNVYKRQDRNMVKNVVSVDTDFFLSKCQDYIEYMKWIDENFKDHLSIYYEDLVTDTDRVVGEILKCKNTLFHDTLGANLSDIFQKEYLVSKRLIGLSEKQKFLPLLKYKETMMKLENKQILPLGIAAPIKNTTLKDKRKIVQNYSNCKSLFLEFARRHNWIDTSNIDHDFWNKEQIT